MKGRNGHPRKKEHPGQSLTVQRSGVGGGKVGVGGCLGNTVYS